MFVTVLILSFAKASRTRPWEKKKKKSDVGYSSFVPVQSKIVSSSNMKNGWRQWCISHNFSNNVSVKQLLWMTLMSCDAAFHIKDFIDASCALAQAGARPPLLLSSSSSSPKHERERNKWRAIAKEKPWSWGAFAFATQFRWVYERVSQALPDWMAQKKLAFC